MAQMTNEKSMVKYITVSCLLPVLAMVSIFMKNCTKGERSFGAACSPTGMRLACITAQRVRALMTIRGP
jgi:hypothetical protein